MSWFIDAASLPFRSLRFGSCVCSGSGRAQAVRFCFVLLIVWGDAPEGLRPAALIFGYLIFGCRLLFAFEPPTSRASSVPMTAASNYSTSIDEDSPF
jgi:hypothetical protein